MKPSIERNDDLHSGIEFGLDTTDGELAVLQSLDRPGNHHVLVGGLHLGLFAESTTESIFDNPWLDRVANTHDFNFRDRSSGRLLTDIDFATNPRQQKVGHCSEKILISFASDFDLGFRINLPEPVLVSYST